MPLRIDSVTRVWFRSWRSQDWWGLAQWRWYGVRSWRSQDSRPGYIFCCTKKKK